MYKFYIFCPDDAAVVDAIINVAANAGAGTIGRYTHVAFIQRGQGNWFDRQAQVKGQPAGNQAGQMVRVGEVRIEMVCPADRAKLVKDAIRKVHPYKDMMIDFVKLEEV